VAVAPPTRPRIVIVGAGFGGLTLAKALGGKPVDVTLIDRQNYHLFQPLLYQVATAGLSPADIAAPIRSVVGRYRNVTVLLGNVEGVDVEGRAVIAGSRRVPYDTLVLATGARHAYFGHDEWEAFAPGIKSVEDATAMRRRILLAFERAEGEADPEERKRLMTLIVVGGGPTGVELAGALAELARHALAKDFRNIDPRTARILLLEAAPRILLSFPEALSENARQQLEKLGVEVRLNAPVQAVDADGVIVAGERIASRTVLWGAGVAASPAGKWIGAKVDRAGRIIVKPDLSVPQHPEIFAIGDTALVADDEGEPLPGVAPVAKQQGQYLAKLILSQAAGRGAIGPFRYRNYGNLATIGRKAAVVDFGWMRLTGLVAWLVWTLAHIYYLIGFRNRIAVALDWMWAYVTWQRGSRLITEPRR
jgi:NADH dehydrogenase